MVTNWSMVRIKYRYLIHDCKWNKKKVEISKNNNKKIRKEPIAVRSGNESPLRMCRKLGLEIKIKIDIKIRTVHLIVRDKSQ